MAWCACSLFLKLILILNVKSWRPPLLCMFVHSFILYFRHLRILCQAIWDTQGNHNKKEGKDREVTQHINWSPRMSGGHLFWLSWRRTPAGCSSTAELPCRRKVWAAAREMCLQRRKLKERGFHHPLSSLEKVECNTISFCFLLANKCSFAYLP